MFRWRSLVREKKIMEMFTHHVQLTREGIILVSKALEDLCTKQYSKEDVLIEKILSLEKEADKIVAHATETIAHSRLTSVEARDFLDLVFHMEKVAKKTKGAAFRLDWAEKADVPEAIRPNFLSLGGKLVEVFDTLDKAIQSMSADDMDATIAHADRVAAVEEEIDNIRRDAHCKLLDQADDVGLGDLRKLEEIIYFLEGIADSCEDAADTIRLITIKQKG